MAIEGRTEKRALLVFFPSPVARLNRRGSRRESLRGSCPVLSTDC